MTKFLSFFKKPLESVSDEITSKFKTPFFSTFIVVWVLKKNLFIYDLFFNSNIEDKTLILNNLFNVGSKEFYIESLITIGISLLVLIIYYIIINLSRIITMISEERIKVNLLDNFKSKTISTVDDVDYWKSRAVKYKNDMKDLEGELSLTRANSNNYKNKLEKADQKLDYIRESLKHFNTKINSTLKHNLYNHSNTNELKAFININEIKKSIDSEIAFFEKKLEPKETSFLIA